MGTKKIREDKDKHLLYEEFIQREETRYHHGYDEEMLQYRYIREGDFRACRICFSVAQLSERPVSFTGRHIHWDIHSIKKSRGSIKHAPLL